MQRILAVTWLIACGCLAPQTAQGQRDATAQPSKTLADTARHLREVVVPGRHEFHGVEAPPPVSDGIILAGKTAEVIHVDSSATNAARDVTRQTLGRIPGANISETEAGGFPANGIGFRGLNPTQSVETNVRQNGANISADVYGYNETYYSPPTEAIEDILVVRGASSLAYGPQFGGTIDYVLKRGLAHSPPTVDVQQSVGSNGLFNTFGTIGGGTGPLTYYGLLEHRSEQGWRPNSAYDQTDAYGRIDYQASRSTSIGLEYTRFRNRIQMPGGLTDAEFQADPRASYRARNWLASPWNIVEGHLDSRLSDRLHLYVTSSLLLSQRYLVWLSEAGGPQVMDTISPNTDAYAPREVERERFYHLSSEARLQFDHPALGRPNTLTVGMREFTGNMQREEGGVGSTGSDFNMMPSEPYTTNLRFGSANVAAFAEDLWHITDRWTVTPGIRAEWLRSTIEGVSATTPVAAQAEAHTFALAGLGTEYQLGSTMTAYGDLSQAYRPITYDALTPFGSTSRISPDLQNSDGYDGDIGVRGAPVRGVYGSIAGFYMVYNHREGLFSGIDTTVGSTFTELATIGNSISKGVEASVTVTPFTVLGMRGLLMGLSFFEAAAYDDARYVSGSFDRNSVEFAPEWISRAGATFRMGAFSTTLQAATQSHAFTDANNTVRTPDDAAIGVIPGYTVLDWSGELVIAHAYRGWLGVSNLTNSHYFTDRTTEYPGPGIIPSLGRSITFGISYAPGR